MSHQMTPYLLVGAALFCVGIFGVLTRRNAIGVLMCIELMLNAANLNLIAFNRFLGPAGNTLTDGAVPTNYYGPLLGGHAFGIIVITVAAAEGPSDWRSSSRFIRTPKPSTWTKSTG